MSSSLETIRYHSGIAGEEVADMVDSLEREVFALREQVEKLTKERDEYRRSSGDNNKSYEQQTIYNEGVNYGKALVGQEPKEKGQLGPMDILQQQLAALAEQNEKLKEALDAVSISSLTHTRVKAFVDKALSLPNLATPVLNKYRAEGMRMGADYCTKNTLASAHSLAVRLRDQAAELEETNDLL